MATAPAEWKRYIGCKTDSVCNGSTKIGSIPELVASIVRGSTLTLEINADTHYWYYTKIIQLHLLRGVGPRGLDVGSVSLSRECHLIGCSLCRTK